MTVTVNLPSEVARQLEEKAARGGRTLEAYLEQLAENDVGGMNGVPAPTAELSIAEFDSLLDDLAAGRRLPHLPEDFSRVDIYADHD